MKDLIICDDCYNNAEYETLTNIFDVKVFCKECAVEYVMDKYIFKKSMIVKSNCLCEKCGSGNPYHYVFDEEYKEENEIPYTEICSQCAFKYGEKELLKYVEKI